MATLRTLCLRSHNRKGKERRSQGDSFEVLVKARNILLHNQINLERTLGNFLKECHRLTLRFTLKLEEEKFFRAPLCFCFPISLFVSRKSYWIAYSHRLNLLGFKFNTLTATYWKVGNTQVLWFQQGIHWWPVSHVCTESSSLR